MRLTKKQPEEIMCAWVASSRLKTGQALPDSLMTPVAGVEPLMSYAPKITTGIRIYM